MRGSNPVLNDSLFRGYSRGTTEKMTIGGALNKTLILISLAMITAIWSWNQTLPANPMEGMASPGALPMIGAIAGFILAIATSWKPHWSPITAPLYALFEGLVLGSVSAMFNYTYPGIVIQAVLGTFGTLFVMLFLFRSGVIRNTPMFQKVITLAIGGIFVVYLVGMIGSFFNWGIPLIHESGPIGIGFSLIVCAVAAFSLITDFDFFEKGEQAGLPKHMEWYAGFALMVTLIWLYFEILRLLSKLNRRD